MTIRNKFDGIRQILRFKNRWFLLAARTLFPGESVHLYRFKNVEFLEDHANGDANGARDVLASPMYRELLEKIDIRGPINVLDLGSNNGGFPLLLKSEGFEIAKLACVELNPKTFSRMRFNIERNFDSIPVTLLNAAVCGESRPIELSLAGGGASDNIYASSSGDVHTVTVEGRTFDEIFDEAFGGENVDICKMDVEGAEFEIIPFSSSSRLSRCRYLLIEIHHEADRHRDRVKKALEEKGFVEIDGGGKDLDAMHYVHLFYDPEPGRLKEK